MFQISGSSNKDAVIITKSIGTAANIAIPEKTHSISSKPPWWNKELSQLRSEKMRAWQTLKRSVNFQNLIDYKQK